MWGNYNGYSSQIKSFQVRINHNGYLSPVMRTKDGNTTTVSHHRPKNEVVTTRSTNQKMQDHATCSEND